MQPRKLSSTDLPQLLKIEEKNQVVPWTAEIFQHCRTSKLPGWVLELGGRVFAFIIVSIQVGECHILNVCVDRDFWSKGYGNQLLNHAMDDAKKQGAGMAYLEVRESNSRAIRLYKKWASLK